MAPDAAHTANTAYCSVLVDPEFEVAPPFCEGDGGPEICDNIDNDCNGVVDDDALGDGEACGTSDEGRCQLGVLNCVNGSLVCEGAVEPAAELCDGADNDCDGATDEERVACSTFCGWGTRSCEDPASACFDACVNDCDEVGYRVCNTPAAQVFGACTAESCDGLDNDCDGVADEGIACQ